MKNPNGTRVRPARAPRFSVLALAASLGATAACGSAGSSAPPDAVPLTTQGGDGTLTTLGTFNGEVRDGHLTISPLVAASDGPPGLSTQGFGEFLAGSLFFETPDSGVGNGSCGPTEFCADITAENGTSKVMDNLYVEITSYTAFTPTGAVASYDGPAVSLSAAYTNLFVNSSSIQAVSYGTLGANDDGLDDSIGSQEWKFNLNLGSPQATQFGFSVKAYASFRRTDPVGGNNQRGQDPIDACSGAPAFFNGADDAEASVALPFPYTLGDITYDRAVIGSNGYLLFYSTGDTVPTRTGTNSYSNVTVTAAGVPIGYYPFWDDLAFDSGNGVCTTTTGTKPNRSFTVTWHQAKISTSQTSSKVWSAERVTYSVQLQETTDTSIFAYNLPTGGAGITPQTRGSTATIGERAIRDGATAPKSISFNTVSASIPTTSTGYAARISRPQNPTNP